MRSSFSLIWQIIYLLLGTNSVFSVEQLLPAGLFSIRLVGVEKCPDVGTNEYAYAYRLQRQNSKRLNMVGNVTMKVPLDERVRAEYVFDKWSSGAWNENSYVHNVDNIACESVMRFLGPVFRDILSECVEGECLKTFATLKKAKENNLCPLKSGVYKCNEFDTMGLNKLKIPAAITGRWRFNLKFVNRKSNQIMGCLRIIALAEPKRI